MLLLSLLKKFTTREQVSELNSLVFKQVSSLVETDSQYSVYLQKEKMRDQLLNWLHLNVIYQLIFYLMLDVLHFQPQVRFIQSFLTLNI